MARLKSKLVEEFVGAAHSDFDKVKELLEGESELVNATWDWGGGDWETALGAAAHCGRHNIAEYLLERGARMDIFAAAMLGHLDVVKTIIAAHPEARTALGPHGISLIDHAEYGGEQAAEVLAYLKSLD